MLDHSDLPHWPTLLQPLADASTALGRLAHALETAPLYPAWLWRETSRAAAKISQIAGYRVQTSQLMRNLAGVPVEPTGDDTGLAAARRVFLIATPLFRADSIADGTDTHQELFEPLWAGQQSPESLDRHQAEAARAGETDELVAMIRELAGNAGRHSRPALFDLFLQLRRHAAARRLSPSLVRLALPLSLHQAGLMPKAAPGLLGGRLPLTPREGEAVTPWLARGLTALAKEAAGAGRRLQALTHQHQAWQARLAKVGLRRHARLPLVVDLLAATPVLSASLVARHLGCSSQGAGEMLRRLSDLGIVVEATPRARWKIYLAGDLLLPAGNAPGSDRPLVFSEPVPEIDREAITATLDGLLADLERLDRRIQTTLTTANAVTPQA